MRLVNVEVLHGSLEFRVVKLEKFIESQKQWDLARYNNNVNDEPRRLGYNYLTFEDPSPFGAPRRTPPSFSAPPVSSASFQIGNYPYLQEAAPPLSSASFQMGNYPYLQEAAPTMSSASFQMASYPYLLEAATKSHKPASSLTYPMLAPSFVSSPTVSFVPPLSTFPSVSSTSTPAIVSTNQSFLAAELPPLFAAPTSTLPFIAVSSSPLTTPSMSGPLPIGFDQNRTYLPSSAIAKHTLKSVEQVFAENPKYLKDLGRYAGTLCQTLAREALFGKGYRFVHPD